jgi:3-hydroxy-9,10-secoandrosta-1,3,5(10)-triene-9,17-dione monooxygenase reductase component
LAALDEGHFRAVVGHFASGVALVTAMHDTGPAGFTCQSFFSLSLSPPMIAIAPGRSSTSWPRVAEAGDMCVNVLASDQEDLARAFSRSGTDKFAGVGWSLSANGAPRLHGALAWIDCTIEGVFDGGDHHLVTARVEALDAAGGRPLIFYRGGFGGFEA